MFRSPLKTVAEKIKPTDSQSSVSSLKFDRSSDFKKFINFIKNETEQLEKIKLPTTTEIKGRGGSKLPGAAGILGLGLVALIANLFGGDGKGKGDNKFRVGGAEASSIPYIPSGFGSLRPKARDIGGAGITSLNPNLKKKGKITLSQKELDLQEQELVGRRNKRKKKIDDVIKKNNKIFLDEFKIIKDLKYLEMREALGAEGFEKKGSKFVALEDFRLEQKYNKIFGYFPGEIDQNLAYEIQYDFANPIDAKQKKIFFVVGDDPEVRRQIADQIARDELLTEINKPLSKADIELMEELAKPFKGMTDLDIADMNEARAALDHPDFYEKTSPEYKEFIREEKFQKVTGTNTTKAKSLLGFKPKYALDDFFTGIGKGTKGLRDFLSPSNLPGGKLLKGGLSLGGNILKVGGFGLDAASFIYEGYKLIDGFVVGDNILTAYYDLGVAFHNMFEPDKTKLIPFITKSRDPRKNALVDKKNQEILESINKAKAAKGINNQVSAQEGSSGIVPFAKAATASPMGITMAPTIYTWKFVTEKLYKQ